MKRFYKEAAADTAAEGGFRILLDGRPMKTPAKVAFVVPTRALAEAIAAEWTGVPDKVEINAAHLPLTRLAATGIDRVGPQRANVVADTAKYAGSDLLCYRATAPDSLVKSQHDAWQPLLDWAAERYGARFTVVNGMTFVDQPAESVARIGDAVEAYDDLALSALFNLTHTSGSVIVGLAVAESRLDAEGAFEAALVDELYQIERWGDDPTALKHREGVRKDLTACTQFLALLRHGKAHGKE